MKMLLGGFAHPRGQQLNVLLIGEQLFGLLSGGATSCTGYQVEELLIRGVTNWWVFYLEGLLNGEITIQLYGLLIGVVIWRDYYLQCLLIGQVTS